MSQCIVFGYMLLRSGKANMRAEKLCSKLQQDAHSFQHTQNTRIFNGKLTEVKAITNNIMFFPFKLLLSKL